jgi:cytochrome c oxidase assembly factor CtaG
MPHLHHAVSGSFEPAILSTILVLTAIIYLRGWLALRSTKRKGNSACRAFNFLFGLLLIWIALASPLSALDHQLLTVHMVQHLLLMTLAPPLIWLASPGHPLLQGLPRRFASGLPIPLWLLRATKKIAEILRGPKFAWLAACITLVGWHIPKLFALGMQSPGWHLFEQFTFLATGLLFWRPVIRPSEGGSHQEFSTILYLFFATLPCDILSGFLAFSDRAVYPMYFSSHFSDFSPLVDQQCAAALMWTCVTIVYLVAGAIVTMRLLSPRHEAWRRNSTTTDLGATR